MYMAHVVASGRHCAEQLNYYERKNFYMEILFLSFICALSYLIILCKIFSLKFICRTQVLWDVLFTFGLPMLFVGTFSGMATAFISGVLFSAITFFLSMLMQPNILARFSFPYGSTQDKDNKTTSDNTNPTRSRPCPVCNQSVQVQSNKQEK
jgi:hypothetical protein